MHAVGGIDDAGGSSPADRWPAEYYSPLLAAIANLEPDHKRRARRDIYDRARDQLFSDMCSAYPPLSGDEIKRARSVLEHAIEQVEAIVLAPEWPATRLQYHRAHTPPVAPIEDVKEEPDSPADPRPIVLASAVRRPRRRNLVGAGIAAAIGASVIAGAVGYIRAIPEPKVEVAVVPPVASSPGEIGGPVEPTVHEVDAISVTGQAAAADPPPSAVQREPRDVRLRDQRAEDRSKQIDFSQSIAGLTAAIRAAPNSAKAYFERGEAWAGQGDLNRAVADFNEAIRRDPNHATAYLARAAAFVGRRQTDRAIIDLTRAIGLAGTEDRRMTPSQLAHAYDSRASLYDVKGLYDREVADLSKAIEIYLGDPRVADDIRNDRGTVGTAAFLPSAYQRRAKVYLRGDRTDQAIADLTKAIEADPDHAVAYLDRGRLLETVGQRDQAIADFRRVMSFDPNMREPKDALARLGATP